jgi:hypothetical protein
MQTVCVWLRVGMCWERMKKMIGCLCHWAERSRTACWEMMVEYEVVLFHALAWEDLKGRDKDI